MKNEEEEKELFSSLKDVPGGSSDDFGKAIVVAAVVAIVGAIALASMGISGGAVGAIPAVLAIIVYKMVRKNSGEGEE